MNTFKVLTASSLIAATVITATAPTSNVADAKGVAKTTKTAKVKQCSKTPKNVILMIGDGMGISQLGAYRYYKDDVKKPGLSPISFDKYLVGSNITISDDPDENITDSGAAGTALATGHKTYNGAISVDKNGKEVETVLEAWKKKGKSTGLIATSELTHATPAVFSAHEASRKDEFNIAVDQTSTIKVNGKKKQLVDVMLGGGVDFYKQKGEDGKVKTDLVKKLQKAGYKYVTTRDQMLKDKSSKQVIGLFAPSAMSKDIDRAKTEPTLKEMTDVAINKLSKNKDGFFLMVEGSQPDWAGHANDLTGMMSEISAFDKAFQSAVNYAKKDCNTLVIALADHATGGLSVGTGDKYLFNPAVVRDMKMTAEGLSTKMVKDGADVEKLISDNMKFELSAEEKQAIVDAAKTKDQKATMKAINKTVDVRANAAWGSLVHTGEEIHVYAYGPGKSKFMGVQDNTQVAKNIFSYVGRK